MKLERIKEALLISSTLAVFGTIITAAFWWDVPGKVVFCSAVLAWMVLSVAAYMVLDAVEHILAESIKRKKAQRRGYIPISTVRRAARWER